MKRLSILCLAILVYSVAASPIPDFPFITVSGDSNVEVAPDTATIRFTVLSYNEMAEEATDTVNETLKSLTDEILALGVDAGSLTADDFEKRAIRVQAENGQPLQVKGYEVSREVEVKVNKIGDYTDVVQAIMNSQNISSISSHFDTSRREEIELELVEKSCAKAKKKALVMSKGVGVDLGGVFAVSDADFSSFAGNFGFAYDDSGMLFGASGRSESPVFVPATIKLYASVSIIYRLGSEAATAD